MSAPQAVAIYRAYQRESASTARLTLQAVLGGTAPGQLKDGSRTLREISDRLGEIAWPD